MTKPPPTNPPLALPSAQAAALFRAAAQRQASSPGETATATALAPAAVTAEQLSPRSLLLAVSALARQLAHLHARGVVHGGVDDAHVRLAAGGVADLLPTNESDPATGPAGDVRALAGLLTWWLAGTRLGDARDLRSSRRQVEAGFAARAHLDAELAMLCAAAVGPRADAPAFTAAGLADAIEDYLDDHDLAPRRHLLGFVAGELVDVDIEERGLVAGAPPADLILPGLPAGIAFEVIDTGFGLCLMPRDHEVRVDGLRHHAPILLLHGVSFLAAGSLFHLRSDAVR